MSGVAINKEKCIGCGNCTDICPHGVLTLENGKACYSKMGCFFCGHCRAICPVEAIEVTGTSAEMEPIEDISLVSSSAGGGSLIQLMQNRRSCRAYQDKEVPLSQLVNLVNTGITAPSGTNSQGWQFALLPTRGDVLALGGLVGEYYRKLNRKAENGFLRMVVKLFGNDSLGRYFRDYYSSVEDAIRLWETEGTDKLFHGAPSAIVVTANQGSSCPAEDALLATGNIVLAAQSFGLGSCLIGFAVEAMRRDRAIMKKLSIPEDEQVYSVIGLGYPAVQFLRPAVRRTVEPRILSFT